MPGWLTGEVSGRGESDGASRKMGRTGRPRLVLPEWTGRWHGRSWYGTNVINGLVEAIDAHVANTWRSRQSPLAIGCCPWLTDPDVGHALGTLPSCLVIAKPDRSAPDVVRHLMEHGEPVHKSALDGLNLMALPTEDGTKPVGVVGDPYNLTDEQLALHDIDLGPVRVAGWRGRVPDRPVAARLGRRQAPPTLDPGHLPEMVRRLRGAPHRPRAPHRAHHRHARHPVRPAARRRPHGCPWWTARRAEPEVGAQRRRAPVQGTARAARWGMVSHSPAVHAEPPAKASPEMRCWTPDQLRTFLAHVADDRLYAVWLLAVTTGMRRGELLGLRWSDLDLEGGRLRGGSTRVRAGAVTVEGPPKTDGDDAPSPLTRRPWRRFGTFAERAGRRTWPSGCRGTRTVWWPRTRRHAGPPAELHPVVYCRPAPPSLLASGSTTCATRR